MKNISLFVLVLIGQVSLAQCTDCSVTILSGNLNNYTFLSNTNYCINGNVTINSPTFENNTTICINNNATLTFSNINSQSNNTVLNMNVYGTMSFVNANTFPISLNAHIYSTGRFYGGANGNQDLTFNGTLVDIKNEGIFKVQVLTFNNNSGEYDFENSGTMDITGTINVSNQSTVHYLNNGYLEIDGQYNNNSNSIIINCGTMLISSMTIGGGLLINTNDITFISDFSLNNPNSTIMNYGNFKAKTISGNGAFTFYNAGTVEMTRFQNQFRLYGPSSANYPTTDEYPDLNLNGIYGKFIMSQQSNSNYAIVNGRLNFVMNGSNSPTANIGTFFSNPGSISTDGLPIYGNCTSCTLLGSMDQCPDIYGQWQEALNCIPVNLNVRTRF